MLALALAMKKEIERALKNNENISISFLSLFINNEIKPIVDRYEEEHINYIDSFIRDDYTVGYETGHKILSLTREPIEPIDAELNDESNREVLLALLLYATQIINSIHSDLVNNLAKDSTSIYITNKNIRAEREVETDENKTLNTILAGAIINKYINPTFNNITSRLDLTAINESNRALNHGILMRYLLAKRSGLDLHVKWVEVRDEKLCKHCREAANGGDIGNGVYTINDVNPPPLHSRCRCILIPFNAKWEGME
jgi:hypothetical protein